MEWPDTYCGGDGREKSLFLKKLKKSAKLKNVGNQGVKPTKIKYGSLV